MLAACLSDWRGSPSHLGRFSRTLVDWTQARPVDWKRRLIWQLDAISSLTSDRRSSTEARTTLAKAVFEFEPGVLFEFEAAAVINLLEGSSTKLFRQSAAEWSPKELHILNRGIDALDLDRLDELERTGTELLPEPAEIDEPEFSSIRDLLIAIENDEELAGLARLARHVMARLTLPKPLTEPYEISVGGVSDISHRGPFDRCSSVSWPMTPTF